MRHDLVPGNTFPDYQLPDHTGTPRKLSELQGDDPLILTLARGHYCPKEHQQHLDLARVARIVKNDPSIANDFREYLKINSPEGILAYYVLVQLAANLCRFRNAQTGCLPPGILVEFLIQNPFADVNAVVANVDAWTGYEFAHLGMALPAERAHCQI